MPTILEANGLTKHYGSVIALDGINLNIGKGITGLLGPNGAGKSTAIKLFLGLIKPTAGSAQVLGARPYDSIEIRARLGYMPEHDCLPSLLAASEFLTHMAQVSGLPPAYARARAADTLRHVGLAEERYRAIGEYSTGMKQRVKLAQALVHDPTMVFLDEPTAGLDPLGREEMLALVRRTGNEFGISILLSSHLMGDVESTCDRIVVLDGGRVLEDGTVSQLTRETETLYVDVDDHREELMVLLRRKGLEAELEGMSIVIEDVAGESYDTVRDSLAESGARLRRMAPRKHRLTEIFRR